MSDFISRQAAIEEILECCPSDFDSEYECGYDDGLRQGVHRLKHMPSAEHQWIPVAERLPSVGEKVLMRAIVKGKQYVDTDRLLATGEWFEYGNVTHWMPLPEPPKGERKDNE